MKRFIFILVALFVLLMGTSIPSFLWWRSYVHHKRDTESLNMASQLVDMGQAEDAVTLIREFRGEISGILDVAL